MQIQPDTIYQQKTPPGWRPAYQSPQVVNWPVLDPMGPQNQEELLQASLISGRIALDGDLVGLRITTGNIVQIRPVLRQLTGLRQSTVQEVAANIAAMPGFWQRGKLVS